jgi:predicted TIM-barrel fold metal-dependent hydrolase
VLGGYRRSSKNECQSTAGIGWAPLWNALRRIVAGASVAEKRVLFAGTARRVYRLG